MTEATVVLVVRFGPTGRDNLSAGLRRRGLAVIEKAGVAAVAASLDTWLPDGVVIDVRDIGDSQAPAFIASVIETIADAGFAGTTAIVRGGQRSRELTIDLQASASRPAVSLNHGTFSTIAKLLLHSGRTDQPPASGASAVSG